MKLLCIDPGPTHSGALVFDTMLSRVSDIMPQVENEALIGMLPDYRDTTDRLIIETVRSYGMPVGDTIFETVEFMGRCRQVYGMHRSDKMPRLEVKHAICHTSKAKDSNIRKALLDRFKPTGGGSVPQIGTKKKPGPLYGVSKHAWSALALAVAYSGV